MPPRTPLGSISGNERRWKDLTPYQRGLIIGKFKCGLTPREVAANLEIPLQTVRDTIKFHPERTDGQSNARSGRPQISTQVNVRNVLRLVRRLPKITYDGIRKELQLSFSNDTIKRILQRNGITNWRAKRRPALTPEAVRKRLKWAKAHLDWTVAQWVKIIFSDECSIEHGKGGLRV